MSRSRPREHREPVEALPDKIGEIWKRLGYASRDALIQAVIAKYPAEQLKDREFRRQIKDRKMNLTYQRCLAEVAQFDCTSAAWRTGTCDAFAADLERRAGPQQLIEDDQFVDDSKKSSDLAMLALFAPRNAPSPPQLGATYISFTLNCPQFLDAGFECGIKAGWLQFDLGKGKTTHAKERRGFGDGMTLNNARVAAHDPDFHKPSWAMEAIKGKCIGWVQDVPADFLLATGLFAGQTVRAEFRVCVSEVGVSFSMPAGAQEKPAKAKLKQRLKVLQLLGDNDGKAAVASIAIRLKAKPSPDDDTSRSP